MMLSEDKKLPRVSVIIPVYQGAPLADCLEHLVAQSYPKKLLEIIVVDNGSPDDIGKIVSPFAGVRLGREPEPGSYRARNKGVDMAVGNVLAFTDADCRPGPEWLSEGISCLLDSPAETVVGGKVTLVPSPAGPNLFELYDGLVAFNQEAFVNRQGYCVTANLFVRRALFDRIGPFRADLRSGGDREWGRRAADMGCAIRFCPDADIEHPARSSLSQMLRKQARLAGGYWLSGPGKWKILFRAFWKEVSDFLCFTWTASKNPVARSRMVGLMLLQSIIGVCRLLEIFRLACGGTPRR